MAGTGQRLEHLRLADLSDREILLVMRDVADPEGWVDAYDVVNQLAMIGDHPHRMVASRLSWLRRFGAVDREHLWDEHGNPVLTIHGDHRQGQRWRLTEVGEQIANGSLRAAQERALDGLDDAQLLMATRALAERARHTGSATAGKLVEREWKHRWTRVNGSQR